jgi:hypothetical protein
MLPSIRGMVRALRQTAYVIYQVTLLALWLGFAAFVCCTAVAVDLVIDAVVHRCPGWGSRLDGRRRMVFLCCVCMLCFVLFHRLSGRRAGCVCVWPGECTQVAYAFHEYSVFTLFELLFGALRLASRILVAIVVRALQFLEWFLR